MQQLLRTADVSAVCGAVGRQPGHPPAAASAGVCAHHDVHAGPLYRCGGAQQPHLRVGLRREHDLPLPARHLLLRLLADHAQPYLWGDHRDAYHPVQVDDQQRIPHRRNPGAPIVAGTPPPMPDSCKSPVPTGASGWVPHLGEGVQFVFSGYSQVEISGNARVEICGEYAGANAPIAIYALPTALVSIPALPPGILNCDLAAVLPCIAVQAGTNLAASSPPSALYIRGAVVGENRDVNLRVDTDARPQRYNGGVVARRVVINTSGGRRRRPTPRCSPCINPSPSRSDGRSRSSMSSSARVSRAVQVVRSD